MRLPRSPTREEVREVFRARGQHIADEEIDSLIPVLARTLPLIAALAELVVREGEPAVRFGMDGER